MSNEQLSLSLAKSQAKRVQREIRILIQMLAQMEDNDDLQPEGTR